MTTTDILSAIRTMQDKQIYGRKPIGIDTLLLVLKISASDLLPLIEELQYSRDIDCHIGKSAQSKFRAIKYDTVSLSALN